MTQSEESWNQIVGELQILVGTVCFGISVVTSRAAMDSMGPYSFNAYVHIIGTIMIYASRSHLRKLLDVVTDDSKQLIVSTPQTTAVGHVVAEAFRFDEKTLNLIYFATMYGIVQCGASVCAQVGLVSVEAGKSAFLTSLYIVFTPVLQSILVDNSMSKLNKWTWISTTTSVVGSFLLAGCDENGCGSSDAISIGEIITVLGAFLWAVQIIISDFGVKSVDCIDFSCAGVFVSAVISTLLAFYFEYDQMMHPFTVFSGVATVVTVWVVVVTTSFLDAAGDVFDMVGQAKTTGYRAAIIMGLDGVVTVIVAFILLNESLSILEMLGCVILLLATFIASEYSSDEEISITQLNIAHNRRLIKRWKVDSFTRQHIPRFFSFVGSSPVPLEEETLLDPPKKEIRMKMTRHLSYQDTPSKNDKKKYGSGYAVAAGIQM
jgi:drug/metabolite transporter (DMT)-like permease